MKKSLLFVGGALLGLLLQAQTLPNPIYTLDFEGVTEAADLQAELVGAGEFRQSEDANFGTYYQNNPEGVKASHENYLIVPTQGFINAQAKNDEQFSIGFWMNAYVANEKQGVGVDGHYYSTAIAAYSQANSYKTFSWPMFSARTRRTLQINCNGWSDYVNEENVNGSNVENNEWAWTKQVETGEDDGEGGSVMANTGFEENWHYVTITFNGLNAKYYVDGVIMNEWNATNTSYYFVKAMNALDALYLGDCGPFWQDTDGAYAYDDIAFYATELTQEQIELIMDIKRGTLSEDDKIIVARGQLQAAKDELDAYCSSIGDTYLTINSQIGDWLMEDIGDPDDYATIEAINTAVAKILEKQNEIAAIVRAYEDAQKAIGYYEEFCANTNYAGAEAFKTALTTAKSAIADPISVDAIAKGLEPLEAAKVAYLFTQTGDVIDVTRVISKPWFVDELYEPTWDEEGNLLYPEGAADHLNKEGWTMTRSENLSGATDLTLYFTNDVQKRTTANLFHSSTAVGGVLDIQQTITGLPAGYYEVSADMSSTSDATNNHVYATSNGVTKVSSVFSLSGGSWTAWEPLTTDKVYVGEDGILIIGATSTTDGAQYKGWFCVTNFQLKYYGTTYDMTADLAEKKTEVENAIETLTLKGDQSAAKTKLDAILTSDASDYDKVSQLTVLAEEVKEVAAQEQAFTALDDMETLRTANLDDTDLASVYNSGEVAISLALEADDATVELFPALNELYAAFVSYATTIKAAKTWPAAEVTGKVTEYVAAVEGADAEKVVAKQAELVALMKSTISGMEASEEAPKDITGLIGNASFDADQYAAWTRTMAGGTSTVAQGEIEFYNNNTFNLSQVITDMPKGIYKLVASGFYRDGNNYATIVSNYNTKATDDSGEEPVELEESIYDTHANVVLYAQSANFNCGTKLVSIASESVAYGAEDDDTYTDYYGNVNHVSEFYTALDKETDPVVYYPYWMWDAYDMITNRGKYAGNEVTFVISEEKEDITIGAEKTAHIAGDWTILDQFKLFYLGQEVPVAIEGVKAGAATIADGKFLENGRVVIVKNGKKYNVAGQAIR